MTGIAIIGLGLVGGSIAHALHTREPDCTLIGIDSDETTRALAQESSIFDDLYAQPHECIRNCELVFVCVPLTALQPVFIALAPHLSGDGPMVTDVSGLKESVDALAKKHLPPGHFVGSHPMAGGTHHGFAHASATLFENAPVAVCANQASSEQVAHWWNKLGARPIFISPANHDEAVGLISHLPYVCALGLTAMASKHPQAPHLAGPGFKRATHYARFNPHLMAPVVANNPHAPQLTRQLAAWLNTIADELEREPERFIEQAEALAQKNSVSIHEED